MCIVGNEMKRSPPAQCAGIRFINQRMPPQRVIVLRRVIGQRDHQPRRINLPDWGRAPRLDADGPRCRFHRSSRACNISLFTCRCLDIVDHIIPRSSLPLRFTQRSVRRCTSDTCFAPIISLSITCPFFPSFSFWPSNCFLEKFFLVGGFIRI